MTSPQNPARNGEQSANELATESDSKAQHDHDDELVDELGEESFPASDPPGAL